jgi:hypothetical protein
MFWKNASPASSGRMSLIGKWARYRTRVQWEHSKKGSREKERLAERNISGQALVGAIGIGRVLSVSSKSLLLSLGEVSARL